MNISATDKGKRKVDDVIIRNGLEQEIESYIEESTNRLKFSLILKPAIISFAALIISFFLDISWVPILGDISRQLGQALFPAWQPAQGEVVPYSFWWLPVIVYFLFIVLAFLAFNKLKIEVKRSPATETIDRIISSYTTVIDSISTALPLLGAALLLISIKLGEEIFLGLSVPFEIKALIVLAVGKLFEPVLDQLGIEFQNIVNHVKDKRERYFSGIQIENYKNLVKQMGGSGNFKIDDLESYRSLLEDTTKYSEAVLKNFSAVYDVLDKLKNINIVDNGKLAELNKFAANLTEASKFLGDDKTIAGLSHLENIVSRK